MNLLDIARKLDFPVLSYGKMEAKEFYGVDYYRPGEEHGENIVYLSMGKVDDPSLSFIKQAGFSSRLHICTSYIAEYYWISAAS